MGEPRTLREALTPYRGYPEPDGQGNRRWAPDLLGAYVGFEDAIDVFRALASLASSDSLRLDPEDPESVPAACLALADRLGREFVSGGAPEALSVASILRHFARERKASALPDTAPEARP